MNERDLRSEAIAARMLADELRQVGADEEAVELSIASETSLQECVSAALGQVQEARAMAEGIAAWVKRLDARQERLERRQERIRDAIQAALETAGLSGMKLPEATLSLSAGKPGVVVTDEAAIPDGFWIKVTSRKLHKEQLRLRLLAGEAVTGAELRNSRPRLTIRTA